MRGAVRPCRSQPQTFQTQAGIRAISPGTERRSNDHPTDRGGAVVDGTPRHPSCMRVAPGSTHIPIWPSRRRASHSETAVSRRSGRSPGVRPASWLGSVQLLAGLAVLAALVDPVAAEPSYNPSLTVGFSSQLYSQPAAFGALSKPGQPLLRRRGRTHVVEELTPFSQKSVVIDSNGAHYTPTTAGFAAGPPVTLTRRDYVTLGHEFTYQQRWQETVRQKMKRATLQQTREGRPRLEWRVPIPAPPSIRRIIGDEGSLRINGSHTATIAGKSQWTEGEVQTLAGRPSAFPTLSMDQESKFSVEGAIGEAINIRITQDTESFGQAFGSSLRDQLANQIKLDYRGDDDDIFHEVQAGNTTLSLPSTRFVGFNQQHKGLFGIRASGRLGPVGFTTIASHEKSESNRQTFRGGAQVDTTTVRDYSYLRNTYFFLDSIYRQRLGDFSEVGAGLPGDYNPEDDIDEATLQVFVNDFNVNNDAEQLATEGRALVDVSDPAEGRTGYTEVGTWHRLDPDNDYALVPQLGYIILRTPVQDRHALAVAYRTRAGRQVGRVVQGDSLSLKLIKARDARPDFPTWDLEWKNVYRIVTGFARGRLFETDQIRIDILREVPGQDPQNSQGSRPYLQIMGLDTHGQDPGSQPDRIIDADYVGLDPSRGHLIFPDLQPFDPQSPKYKTGLSVKVPDIYTKQQQRDLVEASQYIIQVVNSSAQQRINLSQGRLAGIDAESVDVRLNGKRLQRGTDYNVSFTGEVTFLGETQNAVADPGADLEITYESQDLLGLGSQQKTLLGARGEYEFMGGDGVLGMTVLYNNVRSPDQRVRVGSEPARTVVWDMDLRTHFQSSRLTRLVDALPLLKTTAKSDVTVQAEIAQSRPNLNTRGAGYIDDFEGSERPELLSVLRFRWTSSSIPEDTRLGPARRGDMIWYNPFDRVLRSEIWPGQEDQYEVSNNKTDLLVMELAGREGGGQTWNGLMTVFSGGVRDFSQSKFLEIWVRGTRGELHIDMGDIAEDWRRRDLSRLDSDAVAAMPVRERLDALLTGDGKLDTEDLALPGRVTGDGQVSEDEDVGIDGRNDSQELAFYLALAGVDTVAVSTQEQRGQAFVAVPEYRGRDPGDPEGDNWDYDSSRNKNNYTRINGTEDNRNNEGGTRPDTEDLNNDGNLNARNDYYHHTIDLALDEAVPGTESNGWRLFRLPLYAPPPEVARVGSPDSSRIEFARLVYSFTGDVSDTARVEIAQIEIIGNEWQEDEIAAWPGDEQIPPESLLADEDFNITVVGTDENLEYSPPPGVHRRRLSQSRAREREQSLVLQYTELDAGHQATASKVLSRNADYTKYTRLRMYVHGDSAGAYVIDADSSDLEAFVRFGIDGANYYEMTTAVYPGWDDRNEVDVDLLTMSQLKSRLLERQLTGAVDSLDQPLVWLDTLVTDTHRRDGAPAVYRVRGRPSMQQIKQLSVGVRNRGQQLREYSGQAWVDELRLTEPRNDAGMAAYTRVNAQLADFMDVDGQVEWSGQDFRTLSSTERKNTELKTGFTTTTNLHKFLPGSWGVSIPVKMNVNRTLSLPRFGPNSDVELRSVERDSLRAETRKEYYEVSVSKRRGQSWVTRWTVDQMNLRMSETRERSINPTVPLNRREARSLNFSYKMPLPASTVPLLSWMPGFVPEYFTAAKLRYLPTTLDYSLNVNKQESVNWRAANNQQAEAEQYLYKERSYWAGDQLPGDDRMLISSSGDTLLVPKSQTIAVEAGPSQETYDLKETFAAKVNPLSALSADYNLQINRDLRKKYDLGQLAFGREVSRTQNGDVKLNLRWFRWLDQTYGFQANYEEIGDPRRRRSQAIIDTVTGLPAQTVDVNTKNTTSMRINVRLPDLLKKIGAPGRRSGRRSTAADSGNGAGQPFFLRRLVHFSAGHLEPVNNTWRRNSDARSYNLVARPSLAYQFGLDDSLRVRRISVGLTQQDAWSQSTSLESSSGLRLPLGISTKLSYKRQRSDRSGSTQTRKRVEEQIYFPRLSVNWGRADRLPYIKRFITSAQVNVRYDITDTRQAEGSLSNRNLLSAGSSRDFEVSWNGQWRWGPTTRIRYSRSSGEELDYELASNLDTTLAVSELPPVRGRGETEKSTTGFETKYRLKPRSLPLFGDLKSNVDLNFKIEVASETRFSATGDAEPAPLAETDRWMAELKAVYKFSDNFQGSGVMRIEDNRNGLTDRNRKVREVRFSGTLFFR